MDFVTDNTTLKEQVVLLLSSEGHRFLRYCLVGLINTAAAYGFYCGYLYAGLHYSAAVVLSMVTGVFFNYFVTRRFVFDTPVQKHTFIYYVISYGLLYLFSLVLSWLLIDIFMISPYWAGLVSLPANALVSYALLRFIVFR